MFKVVAALLVVFASASARAQQSSPAGEPPGEPGVVAQQVVLGTLVGVLAGVGGTVLGIAESSPKASSAAGAGLALTATAVFPGLAVCAVGETSRWFEGGCAWPVTGAFLGTLVVGIPMGDLVVHVPDHNTGNISGSLLLTAFAATTLAAALGATLGWHLSKHRRQPPTATRPVAAGARGPSWLEMPVQRLAPGPVTFTAPVLAFTF